MEVKTAEARAILLVLHFVIPLIIFFLLKQYIHKTYSGWAWSVIVAQFNPADIVPPRPSARGDLGQYANFKHFLEDYQDGLQVMLVILKNAFLIKYIIL